MDCGGGRGSMVMEVRFGEDERREMADSGGEPRGWLTL